MFGPLSFPEESQKASPLSISFGLHLNKRTVCVLCDKEYLLPNEQEDLLAHLFLIHRLVIADIHLIACLKSYLEYWKLRLLSSSITEFCSTLLLDTAPDGTVSQGEQYYLLADVLPEDKQLREGLQQKRLKWVLEQQASERDDCNFSQGCLFCKLQFAGTRSVYLNHLSAQHNLQLGQPQNLVFVDELLNTIQQKMENLQCLFCEKVFKDRTVLKEHMRKKQHKRINPDNKQYDQFYVINYLEMGKSWQQVQREPDDAEPVNCVTLEEEDSDWSDWEDEGYEAAIVCLFCEAAHQEFDAVVTHMDNKHSFNYIQLCEKLQLDFYQQVKLVNYIRRAMHQRRCVSCDASFDSNPDLLAHMTENQHFQIPNSDLWDQPEFYFPTYENDSFLCHLDDNQEDLLEKDLCDNVMQFRLTTSAL